MPQDSESEHAGLENEADFEASLGAGVSGTEAAAEAALPRPPPASAAGRVVGQPAWAGKTLSHFRLLRLIGEGTMGIVIQALDVHLQRIVALKVLRKRIAGLDATKRVEQFLREARGAARIEHPNVVRIYEINHHAGWWYIAMEMVDGENIERVVTAAGPLSPARACPLISDAATALAVAHGLGVIHRDVKPSNLMITRGGRCKLTDFGLVRLNDPDDPFDFTDRSVGTPKFIAPELIRRQNITPAVDVYSLGATLYYTLTGRPPYVGKTVSEILRQHVTAAVPDARERAPECPDSLASLVQRAMAKDPAARPTAGDLAASLDAETIAWRTQGSGSLPGSTVLIPGSGVLSGASGTVPVQPVFILAQLSRSWRVRAIGALTLIAAAVAALWYVGKGHEPGRPNRSSVVQLAGLFPQAPQTYGVLPPGEVCASVSLPAEAPAFSWVGKVDTAGLRFVASKRGRRYYAIGDPVAWLIRLEDFVGYGTAEEAEAGSKIPAP